MSQATFFRMRLAAALAAAVLGCVGCGGGQKEQPALHLYTWSDYIKPELVARFEAESIRAALEDAQGDIETARLALGLPRKTLYDKLARHQIVPADFRRR